MYVFWLFFATIIYPRNQKNIKCYSKNSWTIYGFHGIEDRCYWTFDLNSYSTWNRCFFIQFPRNITLHKFMQSSIEMNHFKWCMTEMTNHLSFKTMGNTHKMEWLPGGTGIDCLRCQWWVEWQKSCTTQICLSIDRTIQ